MLAKCLEWDNRTVSIPYRLATNGQSLKVPQERNEVSIPYRLATNKTLQACIDALQKQFQFLIGWLQTQFNVLPVVSVYQSFNSLQVGYKRILYSQGRLRKESFNSLQVGYKPIVITTLPCRTLCFNSLQVGYKLFLITLHSSKILRFNSLQVGYKLKISMRCKISRFCFNSLQVGYKRSRTAFLLCFSFLFQFLIGWLQTVIEISGNETFDYSFNSLQVGYKPNLTNSL